MSRSQSFFRAPQEIELMPLPAFAPQPLAPVLNPAPAVHAAPVAPAVVIEEKSADHSSPEEKHGAHRDLGSESPSAYHIPITPAEAQVRCRYITATQLVGEHKVAADGEFTQRFISTPSVSVYRAQSETDEQLINRMIAHIQDFADKASNVHFLDNFETATLADLNNENMNYLFPSNTQIREIAIAAIQKRKKLMFDEKQSPHETLFFATPKSHEIVSEQELASEIARMFADGKIKRMKADCRNNMTIFGFGDAAFFPNELRGVLNEQGFGTFIGLLENLGINLPENLFIVLGTIPILGAQGFVQTHTGLLRCGRNALINIITKATQADIDPKYPSTKRQGFLNMPSLFRNFSYDEKLARTEFVRMENTLDGNEHKSPDEIANQIRLITVEEVKRYLPTAIFSDEKTPAGYNLNNMILCTTAGGLKFWVALEICNTHKIGVSAISLIKMLDQFMRNGSETLPTQVCHILVSNPQKIRARYVLGDKVMHVDPNYPSVSHATRENAGLLAGKREYNGIFGGAVLVQLFNPCHLDELQDEYKSVIDEYNEVAAERRLQRRNGQIQIQPVDADDDEKAEPSPSPRGLSH